MSDAVLDTRVEELELSVRTSEFVGSLGVAKLRDLLALPKLTIPETVPSVVARMMLKELQELFESLGVVYDGELCGPPLQEATLSASGDVATRWRIIINWLKEKHPAVLRQFNPPASADAISQAEKDLGVTLPSDYKEFLLLHNGQGEFAAWVGLGALLPVEKLAATKARKPRGDAETIPENCLSAIGDGVRPVDYCDGWIPISESARGRDFLCLDMDPAPGGTQGQIVEYIVDDFARPLIAKSFADLLSKYFEQAQTGEIDLEEDDDL